LYASSGEIIWHLDVRPAKRVSRQLKGFHSPEALQWLFDRDSTPPIDWLIQTPPERIERLRTYQRDCILAVEKEVIAGRRDLMVAMATGTGKTFLTVAQIYRLLESKLVRKILFLVDRKALAAQAVREFNAFNTPKGNKFTQEYEVYTQRVQREDFRDDSPFDPKVLPNEYLTAPKLSHTFVYLSTIQRMARNLFGAQAMSGEARVQFAKWIPDGYQQVRGRSIAFVGREFYRGDEAVAKPEIPETPGRVPESKALLLGQLRNPGRGVLSG
jgi:type I restriction enzyme, R subunit